MNSIYKKIPIFLIGFFILSLPLNAFEDELFLPSQSKKLKTTKSERESSPRITLEVKGMDVVDVLKILADKGGLNLSISGNVRGRITLFFKDVRVLDALDMVAVSGNLAYEKRGDIIYVMTDREYETRYGKRYLDEKKMMIFSLDYAKVGKIAPLLSQVASKIGKVIPDEATNTIVVIDIAEKINQMGDIVESMDKPIETKVYSLNYLPVDQLQEKVTEMLNKDVGMIRIDPTSNKVIVTDYPDKIREVTEMVKAFDEKPLQVLINAKIIEIKPSKDFYAGIDWNYWIEKYFSVAGSFTIPTPADVTDKVSVGTIDADRVLFPNGLENPGDYSAIIEFLDIFGDTKILSSPRILTLNNQEAKIMVGTNEAYITSSVTSIGDDAVTSQEVNFVEVGVKLFVTPTINKEGYITMKIRPEISSSETVKLESVDTKTDVPIVTNSVAETTVIVKEGVSIIMGGLRSFNSVNEENKVPILGDIPFLGNLFKSKKKEWAKDELVIVLTPQIISGDRPIEVELAQKMQGEMGETEALHEFTKAEEQADLNKDEGDICRFDSNGNKKCQPPLAIKAEGLVGGPVVFSPEQERQNYYLSVVNKVRQTSNFFTLSQSGKVKVRFVIDRAGNLIGEPVIVSGHSGGDIVQAAKLVIERSSPFPPFPHSFGKELEAFEVMLVF